MFNLVYKPSTIGNTMLGEMVPECEVQGDQTRTMFPNIDGFML